MLREEDGAPPDGLGQDFWMAPQLPYTLRQRIETMFEVLAHLPLKQAVAVVADAGKTIALNAPLLELLGDARPELLGRQWSSVMPGWPDRARGFRREGEQVFEEHLERAAGERLWVRVSLGPIAERGEQRAMAYMLFISKPDVETIDHDEVRRLRKSLQLLADTQTDYVVEVDRGGSMTFVSPSFCRAVGASEKDLTHEQFVTRLREEDRAAVVSALEQALKPPFAGEMRARLASAPDRELVWQIDAVIGDGIVGCDLVGRLAVAQAAGVVAGPLAPVAASPVAAVLPAPPPPEDPHWIDIRQKLQALKPGDQTSLMLLARAVADAAGVECTLYKVQRGEAVETAVGWRLPPAV
jgi:PAS domain S-box-containing protein